MCAAGDVLLSLPVVEGGVDLGAVAFDFETFVVDVDDEFAEHGAEEVAADIVEGAVVEVAGVGEQVDVGEDEFGTVVQTFLGVSELFGDRPLLQVEVIQPFTELRRGDCAFCGEVDQAVFMGFELLQFGPQVGLNFPVGGLELLDGLGDLFADGVDDLLDEAFAGDDFGDDVKMA